MKLYKTDAISLCDGKWIAKFVKNEISYRFWDGYITFYFPVKSEYIKNPPTDLENQKWVEMHLSFLLKNNKLWEI